MKYKKETKAFQKSLDFIHTPVFRPSDCGAHRGAVCRSPALGERWLLAQLPAHLLNQRQPTCVIVFKSGENP